MPMTLHLWKLLSLEPASAEFRKLLRLDEQEASSQTLPKWAWLVIFILLLTGPVSMLPLLYNFLCLQKAMKISLSLARQYQGGRQNLLSVTPLGDMGIVLKVAQAFCYAATSSWRRLLIMWLIITLGIASLSLVLGVDLALIVIVSTLITALFLDYVQGLTWGVVVGIYTGLNADPDKARALTIGSYIALQVLFYLSIIAGFFVWLFSGISMFNPQIPLHIILILSIPIALREVIIAAVWWKIRQRINDELPTLKPTMPR
jgi:hypothetical protein